jgi:hypothetical protein
MTLPYKEPSQVLYSLLGTIVEEGRRFASAADLKVSDMSAQSPVGTTLAILERTLKVMSAVQARIHYSMKQEFQLLKVIIRDYTPEEYSYEPEEGGRMAKQSDYDQVYVIPVSDPNAATMSQKVVQYQAVMQLAQGAPQLYDLPYLHRQMLDVLGIKNAQKLVPMQDDQKPRDPVSENMDAVKGKPLKAFAYQDHQAHITTHQTFMQDPVTAQMIGQNPMGQQMMAALQAHIMEHYGYSYRNQIEQQVGGAIPLMDDKDEDEPLSEDVEAALSRLVAQASQQLLQQNQAAAAQQQAQAQAQDPIIQMQMQEVQIKAQDLQRKAAKDQTDAQLKAAQLEIEKQRIDSQERQAQAQIEAKNELEGTRIGIEVAKEERLQANRNELEEAKLGVQIAQIMRPQSPKKESK